MYAHRLTTYPYFTNPAQAPWSDSAYKSLLVGGREKRVVADPGTVHHNDG